MPTTQTRPAKIGRSDRLQFAVVFGIACVFLAVTGRQFSRVDQPFWDAQIYRHAIDHSLNGGDPYSPTTGLKFIYPPIFLRTAALLSHLFPGSSGWYVYLGLNCFALLSIPLILSTGYLRVPWMTPAVALCIFAIHPRLTAEIAFHSGNISNLCYAVVLAAGIPGIHRNRWIFFYIAVACSAVIKLPFLALLILPVFLGHRQILSSILTVAAVFTEIVMERRFSPLEYKAFLDAAIQQVVIGQDVGYTLFAHLLHIEARLPVLRDRFAYPAHLIFIASLLVGLSMLRKKGKIDSMPPGIWPALVLVIAILASPRMLDYDADIAVLPAVLIVVESARSLLRRRVAPLVLALPIAAFSVVISKNPKNALFTLFLSAVLLALAGIPTSGSAKPSPA